MVFLLFCRIGGCLMLMPGFSSARVPVQVRLFIAVAVTLALAPLLEPVAARGRRRRSSTDGARADRLRDRDRRADRLDGAHVLPGPAVHGDARRPCSSASARCRAPPIEDTEPLPALATFITLTATVLLFLTDQHWEVLRALLASYSRCPSPSPSRIDFSLAKLADALSSAFILALQISSPFIVYALIINLMVGIANKLVPQIPVYFISMPFVLAGGLLLLYFTIGESLRLFMMGFMGWLAAG